MNKPLQNHNNLIKHIKLILENCGLSSNQDDLYHYKRLTKDVHKCHIEIYGLTPFPIKIKTAFAEGMQSNQAERTVIQIQRIRDEIFFIYDGVGWKKQCYKKALSEIKQRIGSDHVFNIKEFESWLKTLIVEKENR